MRKRQLFIDTQFSQLDSSDVNNNSHQSSINFQDTNQSYDLKQQAIFNYMLLDLYYQGLQKIQTIFQRRQTDQLQRYFNKLKIKNIPTPTSNINQSNHLQFKASPYKRRMLNSGMGREREQSDSVDKINLLNSIADRIIETKRIKSESKHNNQTFITQEDGKKIMSKLDKLEKIIKSIKRENKLSNQGSVIYVDRYPVERYPVTHPQQRLITRGDDERICGTRRRVNTPVGNTADLRYVHQPYSSVSERYQMQYERQIQQQEQRLAQLYHNRPRDPVPQHYPIPHSPYYQNSNHHHYNPNPPYYPELIKFKQDQLQMSKRPITSKPVRIPTKQNHYLSDDDSNSENNVSDNNTINQEVNNIKNQLNQLKKMNTQYITRNNIIMDETRVKERRNYQNDYRNNQHRQYPVQHKQSFRVLSMAPHPSISPNEFRNNYDQFEQREKRQKRYGLKFQPQYSHQYPNYLEKNQPRVDHRQQQFYRERGYPMEEQYETPVSGSYYPHRVETFQQACRQVPGRSKERQNVLYNKRYQ